MELNFSGNAGNNKAEERDKTPVRRYKVSTPKKKLVKEHSKKDKEDRRSTRGDKRQFVDNLAIRAEKSAGGQDTNVVYKNKTDSQDLPLKSLGWEHHH